MAANHGAWTLGIVAVSSATILTLMASNALSSLFISTAVQPSVSSLVPVTQASRLQTTSTIAYRVDGSQESVAMQNSVQSTDSEPQMQTTSSNRVSFALASFIGFFAAAWAHVHYRSRRSAMEPLDMETAPVLTMAAGTAEGETTYHFIVANSKFMLFDEEHAMELLREKRRFLKEKNIPMDFWIVPNPEFLDNLPDIDKRVLKPCAALVSTDEKWILFMKLRYDRVLLGSFKGSSDIKKALATKGGDPIAAVPKYEVPSNWSKDVPYPKYADDWFLPFLVGASQ